MKSNELNDIISRVLEEEVKNAILSESKKDKKVVYHVTCEGEPLATFNTLDEAKEWCEENKHSKELKGKKKLLIDKKTYNSYEDMIETLDEMGKQLEEKENTDMKNQDTNENFGYAAMMGCKGGEDEFEFPKGSGKKHKCTTTMKELEEEEGMCEGAGCSGDVMETQEVCETCGCKECECGKKETKEGLKGKQKNLDVDGDGDIGGDDLEDLRNGKKTKKINENFRPGVDLGKSFEKFKLQMKDDDMSEPLDDFDTQIQPEEMPGSSTHDDHEDFFNQAKQEIEEGDKGLCEECGTMLNEEGMCLECGGGKMYESKKSVKVRLTEAELMEMITKIVKESVPGLEAVKRAHSQADGKDFKDSAQKIKDYLSFDGNTNPEFPQQVGEDKEKEAYRNTEDENEYVDTYRGKGLQDLDYDNKPSKEFIERLRMALEGDPKMGNGQKDTANTIPSNVGKDLYNSIDKEKEKREEELVSYVKDPAPTTDVNESEKKSKEVVLEEIKRMKDMASYNKKTQ